DPAIAHLKHFTHRTLRITVSDGRVFLGQFAGTDKPLNLLLVNTEEYRVQGDDGQYDGRFVGQVMIPWRIVTKAEAQGRGEPVAIARGQPLYREQLWTIPYQSTPPPS
ncbi:hypothetical protein BD626DRAFT_515733, partial [Schizophyllum amplum]